MTGSGLTRRDAIGCLAAAAAGTWLLDGGVVRAEAVPWGDAAYWSQMRVAAGIGGRPPASFGVVARSHASGHVVASQRGRPRASLRHPPLRLVEAPRGAVRNPEAYPRRPYAGPFRTLEAVAVTRGEGVMIETSHRFLADHVETRWTIRPRRTRGDWSVDVLFPSTGAASVVAVLAGGRRAPLGSGSMSLDGVRWLHVAGDESGYVIVPVRRVAGSLRLVRPAPQDSAPLPGPTLAVALLDRAPLRQLRFAVRVAPATHDRAAAVAARLRG